MQNDLVTALALTFTCWISLDKLLNHFETQFLHLGVQKFKWGRENSSKIIGTFFSGELLLLNK